MGPSAAGVVVLITFPFSDLSDTKVRPAVAPAPTGHDDWLFCQITSRPYWDGLSIEIVPDDFTKGGLTRLSYVRQLKLLTASVSLVRGEVGLLTVEKTEQIFETVIRTLLRAISTSRS